MPEMTVTVRWPDGRTEECYSPSLVMHDHLQAGRSYPVADFEDRALHALGLASERVREKFGFACTSAAASAAQISRSAAAFDGADEMHVVSMQPSLPEEHR